MDFLSPWKARPHRWLTSIHFSRSTIPRATIHESGEIDWHAASLDIKTNATRSFRYGLTYASSLSSRQDHGLSEAQTAAEKAQFVSEQRLQEGVDSKLEVTKSQLITARSD